MEPTGAAREDERVAELTQLSPLPDDREGHTVGDGPGNRLRVAGASERRDGGLRLEGRDLGEIEDGEDVERSPDATTSS